MQQKVHQILYPRCLGVLEFGPQDVVVTCTEQLVFTELEQRLQVGECQALAEVTECIHQPKLHQEVGNFLDLGFLGLPYVGMNLSYHNGVLVPDTDQVLLQVWEMLHVGEGGGGYAPMSGVLWLQ